MLGHRGPDFCAGSLLVFKMIGNKVSRQHLEEQRSLVLVSIRIIAREEEYREEKNIPFRLAGAARR